MQIFSKQAEISTELNKILSSESIDKAKKELTNCLDLYMKYLEWKLRLTPNEQRERELKLNSAESTIMKIRENIDCKFISAKQFLRIKNIVEIYWI